jgi:hypothetical protein
MDIPSHELLALAKAFVAQAKPIISEQERVVDHLRDSSQESRLIRRVLAAVATASDALYEQEALIEQLNESSDGEADMRP